MAPGFDGRGRLAGGVTVAGTGGTQALNIALRILEVLGGWAGPAALPRPASRTLVEIVAQLDIPEASAHKALQVLTETGWVDRVGTEYRLALKVGLVGVGIHEALKRQAETLKGTLGQLEAARAAGVAQQPAPTLPFGDRP